MQPQPTSLVYDVPGPARQHTVVKPALGADSQPGCAAHLVLVRSPRGRSSRSWTADLTGPDSTPAPSALLSHLHSVQSYFTLRPRTSCCRAPESPWPSGFSYLWPRMCTGSDEAGRPAELCEQRLDHAQLRTHAQAGVALSVPHREQVLQAAQAQSVRHLVVGARQAQAHAAQEVCGPVRADQGHAAAAPPAERLRCVGSGCLVQCLCGTVGQLGESVALEQARLEQQADP